MIRLMVIGMALFIGSATAQEVPKFTDQDESLGYALGMTMGQRLRELAVELDTDLYLQGLQDALAGAETRLSAQEARTILDRLQHTLQQRQKAASTAEALPNAPRTPEPAAAAAATALADIKVSFKLDPRLTRSLYMGDRWVSPPTYTRLQEPGKALRVDARVEGIDARGRKMPVSPAWLVSDPDMVAIVPGEGNAVSITVMRPGESRLEVAAAGISREFLIRAKPGKDALQVDISR